MQIPPGSASASIRAATFTPSPKMSSPSTMMSPTLMPMRNSMRSSSAIPAFRFAMPSGRQRRSAPRPRRSKLEQKAVAGRFDDAAGVFSDEAIHELTAVGFSNANVPLSRPMRREYPAMSAGTIAASRRCSRSAAVGQATPSLRQPAPSAFSS